MHEQGLPYLFAVSSRPCLLPFRCSHVPFSHPQRVPAWNAQQASARGPPSRKGSLSIEDTFESISELGPLELMGRELDLAPYGTLRKSQSADSLNSISSVSNTFGQDFTLGQVEVSMDYDAASHILHVAVLQGKDLLEREEASFESCFMRVSLLPDEQIVGISRVSGGWEGGAAVCPGLSGALPRQAGVQGQAESEDGAREQIWMLIPEQKVLAIGRTELGVWGLHLQTPIVCSPQQSCHMNPVCGNCPSVNCVNLGTWQGRDDKLMLANLGTA